MSSSQLGQGSQKSSGSHDALGALSTLTLQTREPKSAQALTLLRTSSLSHEVDVLFQRHQLATQAFDGHGLDELFTAKDVKTASRGIEA